MRPEEFTALGQPGALRDLLTGEPVAGGAGPALKVPLPAWGVKILAGGGEA